MMIQRIFVAALLSACSIAPDATTVPGAPGHRFAWLEGCWQSQDGNSREHWITESSDYAFAASVTLENNAVVFFEHLRIEPVEDRFHLQAYPRGAGPTGFLMIFEGETSVEFANDENDFPQRIRYWRDGETLRARVAKSDGSNPGNWAFDRCEAPD